MHIYDEYIAQHYAAYRPPLHRMIADEALTGLQFETGLDVGCGTGYSAIALADKCKQVIAVDHSQPMLDLAVPDPKVTYLFGSGEALPIQDASVDAATFAGVLPYLNTQAVLRELQRVCRPGAFIVPYDFEVILGDLMQQFPVAEPCVDGTYDHASNLSGQEGISTLKQVTRTVELRATGHQAAHILLSDQSRYKLLASLLKSSDPFERIVDELRRMHWPGALKARIYYSLHQLDSC